MYHTIDYLNDGSKEGCTDWLVAGYLASLVNYTKLRDATVYTRIQTTIKAIANHLHTRPSNVKDSLYRLQDQSRIQIVSEPCRGRNYTLLNIGIDSKGRKSAKGKYSRAKVLFAQTLTPELLWTMTLENYKKAKTTTDKIRCLEYLIEAGERIEDPNKETMRQRLGEKLQALKDGTTAQQVEPAFH